RDRIHQVGAPRLDDRAEASRLAREGAFELLERRQQLVLRHVEGGQVHGRGEDVVGGLAVVDVVVGVDARELRDHLVRVHVRRGARAGLEDVDRELRVVLAGGDLVAGALDRARFGFRQQPELAVDRRGGALQAAQPADHLDGDGLTGDREVLDGLARLAAPQLLFVRHLHSFYRVPPTPRTLSTEGV